MKPPIAEAIFGTGSMRVPNVTKNRVLHGSLFTICSDAFPLSCVSAEACLTGWPNA